MIRIGVIADTHSLLPRRVHDLFAGVALILHAGDIGGDAVLAELELIARVVAVRGNTDVGLRPPRFPDTRELILENVRIFLCHEPYRALHHTPLPDVIVHGHTHEPKNVCEGTTLWFNPGTAGKPKLDKAGPSVGVLILSAGTVRGEILTLE